MDMAQVRRNPIFHMRVFPNETPYFVDGRDKLFAVTIIHCIHRANLVNREQCRWTHPFDRLRQLTRRSLRPNLKHDDIGSAAASLAVSAGSDSSVSQRVVGKVCYELRKGDEISTRRWSFDWHRNRFYSETQRAKAAFAAE